MERLFEAKRTRKLREENALLKARIANINTSVVVLTKGSQSVSATNLKLELENVETRKTWEMMHDRMVSLETDLKRAVEDQSALSKLCVSE
jgi:hypothetical protein